MVPCMPNKGALSTALLACLVIGLSACLSGGAGKRSDARSADSRGPLALPDIPYTKSVLPNGLTLIVHEDHEVPIVAVSVWYQVGSKDEKQGRTGFAHLFEHLMFNGSEHHDDDYFKPFDHVGATVMSGTTSRDVTNYFQTVPATALDMALWMESDRMGHLLGAIDRDKLDEQRGVVQNEKRDRENGPYGKVFPQIAENTYPAGHPYAHPVTGSIEDLDAATLEDVREWFEAHYGAANAVLVVAGDVETAVVQTKVEEYFGDISPGPLLARPTSWVARRTEETRFVMHERVAQARLYKVWNIPEIGHEDLADLMLASDVLARGKSSRLHQRLVYQDQIATDVTSVVSPRELGGQFIIWATVQPGGDLAQVERRLDEELARFLAEGPTGTELQRARIGHRAGLLRWCERLGGFGSKSQLLAASEVHHGDPDAWKVQARLFQQATNASVRAAAREWLGEGAHVVEVHPAPEYQAAERGLDRSGGVPEVSEFPAGIFPDRETAELPNGMKVILARRPSVPLVELQAAARRRLRGRSVRDARDGAACHVHARRGHAGAYGVADRRSAGAPRGDPAGGIRPRRLLDRHVGTGGESGRFPGALCRRDPPPGIPRSGFRPPPAAAAGRHPAREAGAASRGAPRDARAALRRRSRLRPAAHRDGHGGVRPRHHPRRARSVPPHLVQAQQRDAGGRG